ncbi:MULTISPECIES: nucleoside deaminase [Lysinibacillus]|uniref:nucleoside deaminase n=1 Tax=Lysinibacillus TaxID=400634 RepID=UPI0021A626CA|nr:nucleoside deaminase [Lysinibacillus capsici]MCT1539635.1 nucleoside deaminase [Lysinibacillus capsici]MCT1570706.1 nucleoside deaminase [Lysinibacillus capsici]MCT1648109.1 nucleoside deaminase [Lysinibacillus capsici]MCT1726651.1 nucleoside deaminase [Lysinibacillus capsici]MCT1783964.1 nucleoside deaminase [Lysinibacillus capsici]
MDYIQLAVDKTKEGIDKNIGGPFGATIVRGDEIIAVVGNTMMRDTDITAHAEIVAIREASKKLGTMDLSDCVIYATCEPCPMCVGAIIWSGIKEVHYCNTAEDAHVHGFSDMHLRDYLTGKDKSVLNMQKIETTEECDALFHHFNDKMANSK